MRIVLASVPVQDQTAARDFYTRILGFRVKRDEPAGEHRWLTVVSPEDPEGVELLLEPLAFPPARTYQAELFAAGIPATAFAIADLDAEVARLRSLGVVFRGEPVTYGATRLALFEDGCGNLIQIFQP